MKQVLLPILGTMVFITVVGLLMQGGNTDKFKSLFTPKQKIVVENSKTVKIRDREITVEIADTNSERQTGLSGKTSLGENDGMLFVFDKQNIMPSFWMKDMNFAIDIIWINDGKIEQIDKDAKPEPGKSDKDLKIYTPEKPIDYVLEVNSGFSEKHSFKVGDKVEIPNLEN